MIGRIPLDVDFWQWHGSSPKRIGTWLLVHVVSFLFLISMMQWQGFALWCAWVAISIGCVTRKINVFDGTLDVVQRDGIGFTVTFFWGADQQTVCSVHLSHQRELAIPYHSPAIILSLGGFHDVSRAQIGSDRLLPEVFITASRFNAHGRPSRIMIADGEGDQQTFSLHEALRVLDDIAALYTMGMETFSWQAYRKYCPPSRKRLRPVRPASEIQTVPNFEDGLPIIPFPQAVRIDGDAPEVKEYRRGDPFTDLFGRGH